jgi:hypothetical protein
VNHDRKNREEAVSGPKGRGLESLDDWRLASL